MSLIEQLKILYDGDYTDEDLKRLSKKIEALKIEKIDELTALLTIVDYDVALVNRVPNKIKAITEEVCNEVRETSRETAAQSVIDVTKNATENLTNEVTRIARDIANKSSGRQIIIWSIFAISFILALLILMFCIGNKFGYENGRQFGFKQGFDQKQNERYFEGIERGRKDLWYTATHEKLLHPSSDDGNKTLFEYVLFLEETGTLFEIVNCNLPGWKYDYKRKMCITNFTSNGKPFGEFKLFGKKDFEQLSFKYKDKSPDKYDYNSFLDSDNKLHHRDLPPPLE